eukprot:TRINITY_DN11099_c0_g1_i2.p1 TRINITY_DN11099_c0_g1~~TRINITY_DN11099_c0_g1_i2.p1  ORF type:complete len:346 (-),score=53.11 TRINITY_DN11099_c0_g1_i2:22-1059(-)
MVANLSMAKLLQALAILAATHQVSCVLVDDVPACAEVGIAYNDPKRNNTPNEVTRSAAVCQMTCKYSEFCRFFTWYSDTGACWLQGQKSEAVECRGFDVGCWFSGFSWFQWALLVGAILLVTYIAYLLYRRRFGRPDQCLIWPASAERSGEEIYLSYSRGYHGATMNLTREQAWWTVVPDGRFGGFSSNVRLESADSPGLFMTVRKKGSAADKASRGIEGMLECVNPVPTPDDIMALTESKGSDSLFRFVPALNKNSKMRSIESMKNPGSYVCHFDGKLYCHDPNDTLSSVGLTLVDEMSWVVQYWTEQRRDIDPMGTGTSVASTYRDRREDSYDSVSPLVRDFH